MNVGKDLVAASATQLILAILSEGESYGYAIIKRVAELSVDYYYFTADTRNNLGGQPPVSTYGSGRLGQEITPTLQWMVGQTLYIQALATFLVPGPGLSQVLPEPTRTWKTFQLSFYWFL